MLLDALVWQRKLAEHAQQMELSDPFDHSTMCVGCRRYVAAMLRGATPEQALTVACDIITEAREAMAKARVFAKNWNGTDI